VGETAEPAPGLGPVAPSPGTGAQAGTAVPQSAVVAAFAPEDTVRVQKSESASAAAGSAEAGAGAALVAGRGKAGGW